MHFYRQLSLRLGSSRRERTSSFKGRAILRRQLLSYLPDVISTCGPFWLPQSTRGRWLQNARAARRTLSRGAIIARRRRREKAGQTAIGRRQRARLASPSGRLGEGVRRDETTARGKTSAANDTREKKPLPFSRVRPITVAVVLATSHDLAKARACSLHEMMMA